MRSCFPHLHSAMCATGATSHLSSDGNPSTCDPRDFPTLVYMAHGPGLTLHPVCSDSSQNKCGFTGNWGLPLEAQFGHEKSSLGSSERTQQCNFDLIFHLAFFEEAKTLVCHRSAWRQQVVYFSKKKKQQTQAFITNQCEILQMVTCEYAAGLPAARLHTSCILQHLSAVILLPFSITIYRNL